MEPLTIEIFNPDMIKAINSAQKKSGSINYTSVKFEYNGGKIPPLKVDVKSNTFGGTFVVRPAFYARQKVQKLQFHY